MSFPWHNPTWRETAEFLGPRTVDRERVLAPDQFWAVVDRVDRFVPDNLGPGAIYDWVVLDLGRMAQLPRPFLERVAATMTPVFVNREFVVWHAGPPSASSEETRDALADFWARLAALGPEPSVPNACTLDLALADAPRVTRFAAIDDAELRACMNDLFRRTGYRYPTLRDQTYYRDLHGHVEALLARLGRGRVLDLATGGEAFVAVPPGVMVVRVDFAEVGVARARSGDDGDVAITHAVDDVHALAFPDAVFDAVVFTDAIEHVRDPARVLRESARVLRPGGELLVSFANRDSVNQLLTEKLGYPRFTTNHQHFGEFTLAEMGALVEAAGFEVRETAGISLYPYWGVPRVDEIVRTITDDDPEFVATMSELGRRAGAEFAYTGIVLAGRSPDPSGHTRRPRETGDPSRP